MSAMMRSVAIATISTALFFGASPEDSRAQTDSRSGRVYVVWEDPPPGAGAANLRLFLAEAEGVSSELRLPASLLRNFGNLAALDRKNVQVTGRRLKAVAGVAAPAVIEVQDLRPLEAVPQAGFSASAAPVVGSEPWVTVLCRFADDQSTPHSVSWYEQITGGDYPGIDHFWREVSFNQIDLAGSQVAGWYDLPEPRSAYMNGDTPNLAKLKQDCADAADADVYFPAFSGINFQFNASLGCCSWGGSSGLDIDGTPKAYRVTWMADWANQKIYAHETGHGFGLPHSSGPYGNTYDSDWDVMSRGRGTSNGTYGWIAPHTIAGHKDMLGWISSDLKYQPAPGSSQNIHLSRVADPAPAGSYHMAKIPTPDGGFYTVEARRYFGYDQTPGEAVVLHKVTAGTGLQVVDPDGDGNPNDDGAMWLPGETFTDEAAGVTVTVERQHDNGYDVTISLTGDGDPTPLIALNPASLNYDTQEDQNPAGQSFTVQNAGTGTLDWTASADRNWIGLASSSGSLSAGASTSVSVDVDASGMSAGSYNGTVSISGNADNSPQQLAVTLTVTAAETPLIAVTPGSLTYDTQAGQNPAGQSFTVQNAGTGTLNWTTSADRNWIGLASSSGSLGAGESEAVAVNLDVSGMSAGSYSGTVAVTGNADNSPQELVIALTITAVEAPVIAVSPASLTFATNVDESPTPLDFYVQNSGQGTLDWSVSENRNWLGVSPQSGSLAGGATAGVTVTVDASGLTAGTYSGTVTVSGNADNSPQTLAVELQVLDVDEPLIAVSPSSLAMETKGGKKNAPKANLGIGNAGSQTLSWSATTNQSWLTLAAGSGSLASGVSDSVGISLSLEGLEPGTYQALITVSGNATNSPQTIPVELKLTKGAVIKIRRGKLTYAGSSEEQPLAKSFTMENEGDETSNWSVSTDQEWIHLASQSGTLTVGDTQRVGVSVSMTGLEPGNHSGTITVVGDEDLDSLTLDVSLTVSNGPGVKHSVDQVAAQLLDRTNQLGPDEIHYLDQVGNGNGQFDVGDLRAWLMQRGVLSGAPPLAVIGPADLTGKEMGK